MEKLLCDVYSLLSLPELQIYDENMLTHSKMFYILCICQLSALEKMLGGIHLLVIFEVDNVQFEILG